jgi:hypothetical protein
MRRMLRICLRIIWRAVGYRDERSCGSGEPRTVSEVVGNGYMASEKIVSGTREERGDSSFKRL